MLACVMPSARGGAACTAAAVPLGCSTLLRPPALDAVPGPPPCMATAPAALSCLWGSWGDEARDCCSPCCQPFLPLPPCLYAGGGAAAAWGRGQRLPQLCCEGGGDRDVVRLQRHQLPGTPPPLQAAPVCTVRPLPLRLPLLRVEVGVCVVCVLRVGRQASPCRPAVYRPGGSGRTHVPPAAAPACCRWRCGASRRTRWRCRWPAWTQRTARPPRRPAATAARRPRASCRSCCRWTKCRSCRRWGHRAQPGACPLPLGVAAAPADCSCAPSAAAPLLLLKLRCPPACLPALPGAVRHLGVHQVGAGARFIVAVVACGCLAALACRLPAAPAWQPSPVAFQPPLFWSSERAPLASRLCHAPNAPWPVCVPGVQAGCPNRSKEEADREYEASIQELIALLRR